MGPLWLTADTCIVSDKNYKFLSTSTSNLFDTNVLSPRPLTTSMNSSQFTSSSPSASDNTRSASYNANDGVAAPAHTFAGTRTSNYHDQSAGSMCAPKLPDRSGFLGATILRANKSSVLPKTNVLPSVVDFVAARTQKHKETNTPKVAVPKRSVWSSTCGNPCAPEQNRGKNQPPKNEVTKQNPSHRMHGWYSVQQARHNFVKQKKKDIEEELAAIERGEMLKKDNKHPPATHVYAGRYSNKPAGCNVIEAKKRTEEEIQMAQRKKVTINGELKKRALMTQANKTPMSTMKTDRPDPLSPQDTHSLMSPVKLPARSAVPEKRTVVNKTLHDVAARTAQTHSDTAHARSVHPGICPKLPAHSPGGKVHVKAVSQGVCPKFSVQPRRNPIREHFYARSPTAPQPTSHGAPGNLHASNDADLNMTETGVWASMDLPRSTPRVLTLCDVAARRAQTHSDTAHAWSVPAINKLTKVDDDLAMTETGVWANLDLPRSTPRTLTLRDVAARRAQTHSDAAHAWSVPAINKLAKVWQLREKIRRRVLTEIHGLQAPKAVSYDKNTTLRDVPARSVQTHSTAHMRSVPPGLCPKLRVHPPGDKVYVKPVPQRIRPELSAQSHGNPIRENVYARSPPFPQPVSYGSLGNLHASNDKNLDMTEMGVWANVDLPRPTQRTVERPLIVPALNMDLVDREVSHSSRSASEIPPTATDTTGFLPGAMCSQTRG